MYAGPVEHPFRNPPDVPSLNAAATQRLSGLLDAVHKGRRSTSVLLLGPAGSGKTHQLVRLRHRAEEIGALLIYATALGPDQAYRDLLRSLARHTLPAEGALPRLFAGTPGESEIDEIAGESLADREAVAVLLRARSLGPPGWLLLRRWLSGDPLDAAELKAIGARRTIGSETQARQVLHGLALLSLRQAPLIIAIDQIVDPMIGYLVADLRNTLPGTLLVTLSLPDRWHDRGTALPRAHRDRMAEHICELAPLTALELEEVARLQRIPAPGPKPVLRRSSRSSDDDFEEPSVVLGDILTEEPTAAVPVPLPIRPEPTRPSKSILPLAMAPAAPPPLSQGWRPPPAPLQPEEEAGPQEEPPEAIKPRP